MLLKFKDILINSTAKREILSKKLADINKHISTSNDRLKYIEKAQIIFQQTAKETQEKLRFHIEDLVQSALDSCFPGEYDFIIDFEIKRGKTEANMYLERDGGRVNPMDATGGGVVDIISFALRLVAWSLSKTDPIIVLDEPFKFLSSNLRPLAGELMKSLSEKLKLQIIMISHDPVMIEIGDKIFEIEQKRGRSYVKNNND